MDTLGVGAQQIILGKSWVPDVPGDFGFQFWKLFVKADSNSVLTITLNHREFGPTDAAQVIGQSIGSSADARAGLLADDDGQKCLAGIGQFCRTSLFLAVQGGCPGGKKGQGRN